MADKSSKIRGIFGKLANVSLIFLGFLAVFFSSHSDSNTNHGASGQLGAQDDMLGSNVAHADVPGGYSSGVGGYSSSGSGSGGCGAGDGGCGAGGAGSGCGGY